MLTQERLKELVSYDENTGFFTRKTCFFASKIGTRPEFAGQAGGLVVKLNSIRYRADHLAFLFVTGSIPKKIQHIDGNQLNNSFGNLRDISEDVNELRGCDITQDSLKKIIEYNAITGEITWLLNIASKAKAGNKAGASIRSGYRIVQILNQNILVHRLAFLYMTGRMPKFVDHINGNASDNRWTNLREATHQQNSCNGKIRSTNTTGFKGVCFNKARNSFTAQIVKNGKNHSLGYFKNAEDAHLAYCKAADTLHGEFANYGKQLWHQS